MLPSRWPRPSSCLATTLLLSRRRALPRTRPSAARVPCISVPCFCTTFTRSRRTRRCTSRTRRGPTTLRFSRRVVCRRRRTRTMTRAAARSISRVCTGTSLASRTAPWCCCTHAPTTQQVWILPKSSGRSSPTCLPRRSSLPSLTRRTRALPRATRPRMRFPCASLPSAESRCSSPRALPRMPVCMASASVRCTSRRPRPRRRKRCCRSSTRSCVVRTAQCPRLVHAS